MTRRNAVTAGTEAQTAEKLLKAGKVALSAGAMASLRNDVHGAIRLAEKGIDLLRGSLIQAEKDDVDDE